MKAGIIGIVGGMGPEAGASLSFKIISNTIAEKDQDHLPQILYSVPADIVDRTEYILGRIMENPGYSIAQALLKLESMGVTIAGIACNTAHAPQIFNTVKSQLILKNSSLKLLHMIEEVAGFLHKNYPGVHKIGIMGTTGTYISGLYNILGNYDLEVINVSENNQEQLHLSVYHPEYGIKSVSGKPSERAMQIFSNTADSLIAKNAELIILGCTELPFIYSGTHYRGIPVIDSGHVLARALIYAHSPEKLKPL